MQETGHFSDLSPAIRSILATDGEEQSAVFATHIPEG